MKNLNLTLLFCGLILMMPMALSAQDDCTINSARTTITTSDIEVMLPGAGSLWWNGSSAGYLVEDSADPNRQLGLLFAGGLWLGGFDPGANLKMAASTYGLFNGQTDYWSGPLDEQGNTTPDNCNNYDRFWKVNRADIDALLDDFEDNGTIDSPVPTELQEWPAKGNPFFENLLGFALPDTPQGLAPFFDQDGDGLYDPSKGDYPQIKGADQAVWWVFNDAGGIHMQSTGSDPIHMEIRAMAYTYNSAEAPINRATFYDYTIVNRGLEPLDSAFIGLWADADLGCFRDDYIGCNPDKNLFYAYNADALDDDSSCTQDCNQVEGFCDNIPVVGIKILKGSTRLDPNTGELIDNGLSSLTYYDSPSYNPIAAMNDPQTPVEFYNYLTGAWRDGIPFTEGGSGYNPQGASVQYAFPGNPRDITAWSMCSENLGFGDRRALLNSGPFNILPGGINQLTFVVFLRDAVQYPCPDLSEFFNDSDLIETFYEGVPTSTYEVASPELGIQLSPNPIHDFSILSIEEGQLQQVDLFSANGQLMRSYTGINNSQLKIERQDLQSGMYFYRLQSEAGKWYSGKLLVQ